MKTLCCLLACLASGLAVADAVQSRIYTDGTCIKSGISGLASSKSGCDSIGGVWRSKYSEQVVNAANGKHKRNLGQRADHGLPSATR